jgi:hypothetical protein
MLVTGTTGERWRKCGCQLPLNIEPWNVPIPTDIDFIIKVKREIVQANLQGSLPPELQRELWKHVHPKSNKNSGRPRTTNANELVIPETPITVRDGKCVRCRNPLDEFTRGCKACANRHLSRRVRKDKDKYQSRVTGTCARCNMPWDEYTPGCKTCQERKRVRKRREAA